MSAQVDAAKQFLDDLTAAKAAEKTAASDLRKERRAAAIAERFWSSKGCIEFIDPLTHAIMSDPVTAADGITYERKSIEVWFLKNPCVSPMTREPISNEDLTPNNELREKIKIVMMLPDANAATSEIEDAARRFSEPTEPSGVSSKNNRKSGQAAEEAEVGAATDTAHAPKEGAATDTVHAPVISDIRELNRIFAFLDPVREVLNRTLADWKPPQIVVIGQESSGKSSLLERISMMSIFPRLLDDGSDVSLCTRIRIEVQLRNCAESHIPELRVTDLEGNPLPGFESPILIPAQNGHIDVRREMNKLIADTHDSTPDAYVTDRIIKLLVRGPQVPTIDLVDLPGIRQTGPGAEATQRLVDEHVTANAKRSLFLFVMRAGEIKANNAALKVIEDHDEMCENTIGVLTMLDRLSSKEIAKTMKQVMNGEDSFKQNGWVATMNRPLDEEDSAQALGASEYQLLNDQAEREVEFFTGVPWPEERKKELTTSNLVVQLNSMFEIYLQEKWLPVAMQMLQAHLQQIDFEMLKLGIVEESPLAKQEEAAAMEVEHRMGSTMKPMREAFNTGVLMALRDEVTTLLASKSASLESVSNQEVGVALENLGRDLKSCVDTAVAGITLYWTDKVHASLKAETTETKGAGTLLSLTTTIEGLDVSIPWTGAAGSRMELYKNAKKQSEVTAFIQLSNYTDYTDAVIMKCAEIVDDFQARAKEGAEFVLSRFLAHDSPWLALVPDDKCEKVAVTVDSSALSNALVSAFVRYYPPDAAFLRLHEGVALGKERAVAREQLDQLTKDFDNVKGAVAAMKKAFAITLKDEATMAQGVEWAIDEERRREVRLWMPLVSPNATLMD
jgi:GTP-binding protein EngB required for normal cell division